MTAYQTLVALHAGIGVIALGSFWSAAFLRKGSPLHRRAGQLFLLAMTGIVATGIPMALYAWLARDRPVTAAFLAYLLVITSTGMWTAWRAIRDKQDVARFTGPMYGAFAWLSLLSGLGVLALGLRVGAPLLSGFSVVGLVTGIVMLRKRRNPDRLAAKPRWWLIEHYTAMLGNGVATHIAFLGIGLPRLLPGVDGTALHYTAWFGPLVVATVMKLVLDRKWKPKQPARAATAVAATSRNHPRRRDHNPVGQVSGGSSWCQVSPRSSGVNARVSSICSSQSN